MEFVLPDLSWANFFYYLLLLGLVYLALWLAPLPVRWLTQPGLRRRRWLRFVRQLRTAYEPIALVLAVIALVFVNPFLHGLVVVGLIVLGWGGIRNYIDGQLLRLTTPLARGQEIALNGETGTVRDMFPLTLVLQTEDGSRIVPYRNLRKEGFTISRGARISGWRDLLLTPDSDPAAELSYLRNHLFTCPYLNWAHEPQIRSRGAGEEGFAVRLLLEQDVYQDELLQLMREWGYAVSET